MIYGFDSTGGFYVIDHEARQASYCYRTSIGATAAKTAASRVAAHAQKRMEIDRQCCPPEIIENHYLTICRAADVQPADKTRPLTTPEG